MNINQFYINKDGKYHEFSLIHYISAVSLLTECNNSQLTIWTNTDITSRWIELLKEKYPTRLKIELISSKDLDYDRYDCVSHLVDHLKIKTLSEGFDSLIIDSDFICFKDLVSLFNDSVVSISEERDPLSHHFEQLALGWCYSKYPNEFISDWLNAFKSYKKGMGWTYWAGVIPTKLLENNKYSVHVVPDVLTDPYTYTRDKLADLFLHNRYVGDAYMIHTAESIAWDRYLKPLDLEHIMTVDTTFTKAVRKYVTDLWDFKLNIPKVIY